MNFKDRKYYTGKVIEFMGMLGSAMLLAGTILALPFFA